MVLIPNNMQLILQFGCSRLLLNEVPNNLYLLLCTRFKASWIMKDKVASFICNLMLNVMFTSLTLSEHWAHQCTPLTCLNGWYQMGFTRFHLCTWLEQNVRKSIRLSFNSPFLSCIMMGFVPFATPQTFSRIVVLPALALPMTRMRKWEHLYWSLSIVISSICAVVRDHLISFSGES